MRSSGIEPEPSDWESEILPLYYERIIGLLFYYILNIS